MKCKWIPLLCKEEGGREEAGPRPGVEGCALVYCFCFDVASDLLDVVCGRKSAAQRRWGGGVLFVPWGEEERASFIWMPCAWEREHLNSLLARRKTRVMVGGCVNCEVPFLGFPAACFVNFWANNRSGRRG